MNKSSITFIAAVIMVTGLLATTHLSVQQSLRQSANDPQIQLAEDTAAALNNGELFQVSKPIDVANSLATFIEIYDTQGKVVKSSGLLDGQAPVAPLGVLQAAQKGENRVTWQPRQDVRLAAVVTQYKSGYVLAARNLREVEKREKQLGEQILLSWVLSMVILGSVKIISKQ